MGTTLLALLALLTPSPQLEVQGHAVRLPALLASLSESTGMELSCSSEFQNRVVYVSVKELDTESTLTALATSVDGKWEKTGKGRTLVADLVGRSLRRSAFLERVAVDMRETVSDILAAQPKEFDDVAALGLAKKIGGLDLEEDFRAGDAIAVNSPVGRLLFTLLSMVDMKECAALGPNELFLLSNEKSLFFNLLGSNDVALKKYDKEQAVWDQYVPEPKNGMRSSSMLAAEHSTSDFPAGKVFVGLSRYSALTTFVASIVILDTNGGVKGIARFNVFPKGLQRALEEPPIDASGPEANIRLSEKTKTYLKAFALDDTYKKLNRTDALYRELLDPMEHEPLDYWIGDLLRPLGDNVFATVDDNLLYDFNAILINGQVSPTGLVTLLKERSQYEVTVDGKTTIIRPYDPNRAGRETVSRTLLRRLMVELDDQGFASVDSLLDYVKGGVTPMGTNAVLFFHSRAIVPGYERLLQFLETTSLRVLSSFSPQERALLDDGQTLSFGQLSAVTQRTLNNLVGKNILWDHGRDNVLIPGELRMAIKYPNGMPATMQFRSRKNGDTGMAVWNAAHDNYTAWTTFGSPSRVAGAVQSFKRQNVESRFWFGSAVDVSFEALDGNTIIGQSDVFIPLFDLRKEQPRIEDLPESVRQMISGG